MFIALLIIMLLSVTLGISISYIVFNELQRHDNRPKFFNYRPDYSYNSLSTDITALSTDVDVLFEQVGDIESRLAGLEESNKETENDLK